MGGGLGAEEEEEDEKKEGGGGAVEVAPGLNLLQGGPLVSL